MGTELEGVGQYGTLVSCRSLMYITRLLRTLNIKVRSWRAILR